MTIKSQGELSSTNDDLYVSIDKGIDLLEGQIRKAKTKRERMLKDSTLKVLDVQAPQQEVADEILKTALNLFNERILLFHIKDYKKVDGKIVQCGVGQGIFDYDLILDLIHEHNPNALLVLEGTVGEDLKPAVEFITSKLGKYSA